MAANKATQIQTDLAPIMGAHLQAPQIDLAWGSGLTQILVTSKFGVPDGVQKKLLAAW